MGRFSKVGGRIISFAPSSGALLPQSLDSRVCCFPARFVAPARLRRVGPALSPASQGRTERKSSRSRPAQGTRSPAERRPWSLSPSCNLSPFLNFRRGRSNKTQPRGRWHSESRTADRRLGLCLWREASESWFQRSKWAEFAWDFGWPNYSRVPKCTRDGMSPVNGSAFDRSISRGRAPDSWL